MGVDVSGEQMVSEAFVELFDTLVPDFEVSTFLGRLADTGQELLRADAAIVRLADDHGRLDAVSSSSARERVSTLVALPGDEGPSYDAVRSSTLVTCPDLDAAPVRWPTFVPRARSLGFRSVHVWPLRYDTQVLGAVELYREAAGDYGDADARLAETLARLATIIIVRERRQRQAETLAQQLQRALNSRLVIEQAKGILAERRGIAIDEAFTVLRGYARSNQMRLAVLAHQVIEGTADNRLYRQAAPGPSVPASALSRGPTARGSAPRGSAPRASATRAIPAGRPQGVRPGRPSEPSGMRPTPEPTRRRPEQRRPPRSVGPAESVPGSSSDR